jgi:hypothetical protein
MELCGSCQLDRRHPDGLRPSSTQVDQLIKFAPAHAALTMADFDLDSRVARGQPHLARVHGTKPLFRLTFVRTLLVFLKATFCQPHPDLGCLLIRDLRHDAMFPLEKT